jgi:predicted dienelactone hydrolase
MLTVKRFPDVCLMRAVKGDEMRPIEILLLLANALAFFGLAVPLPSTTHWSWYLVLVALLVAGAQVVVEGTRGQMVPAYALTGLLLLSWRLQDKLASGLILTPGLLGLAVSTALPLMIPVFRFPKPTGPYAIGTVTYHWVGTERVEVFSADPIARRELMAQIWYPAKANPKARRAAYLPDAEALLTEFVRVQRKQAYKLLFGNLKYITTNAILSAPVADDKPSYLALIFLEGITGFRQMNTFQVEELVSHGYIVVAIDQPYTAAVVVFPDGRRVAMPPIDQVQPLVRQSYLPAEKAPTLNGRTLEDGIIPYLAQDVGFTLDQLSALNRADPKGILTGRLDLERAGVFGMSLGGIVAGEACRVEPRLRACLIMDAPMPNSVVRAGLKQPSMWITRDADIMRLERERAGGWPEVEIAAHLTSMRAVFDSLEGDGYFVQVPGIFHSNFTDIPAWSPLVRWLGAAGPMDVRRAHDIINAYSVAFFDRELKGQEAELLDGKAEEYPEVMLRTKMNHRPSA